MQSEISAPGWPGFPGFIHYEQERYEEFLKWVENGLGRDPESLLLHEYRFIYRALHGDWKRAWQDWEYRDSRQPLLARFSLWPEWTGDPIPGKTLLVLGEHGIGDQIMFSRWLSKALIAASAQRVVFVTRPELRRWNFGPEEWLTVIAGEENIPAFDFWIGLESLPLVTGWHEPFPAGASRNALNVKRVGICWHGDPRVRVDQKRSTTFGMWLPLLQMPGLSFRSLQYNDCPDPRMEPLGPVTDIADTGCRMEDLDLVITVDTAIGHLAGAMGIPVWTLNYRPPEWRWGLAGESTDWYQSMRLFRQERRGEWGAVFERVQAELLRVTSRASG